MHTLPIDVNRRQLNKLMKGGRVRVKKGTGFNLIVHPERYNIVSRAFAKNKGSEVQLTPEEIQMNQYDEEESESEDEEEEEDDEYETEARRMGNIGQGLRGRGLRGRGATGSMLKNTAANATANLINAGSDRAANEMLPTSKGTRVCGTFRSTKHQLRVVQFVALNGHNVEGRSADVFPKAGWRGRQ